MTPAKLILQWSALVLTVGLVVSGCGGGGSPTAPDFPSLVGASVNGQVVGSGSSSAASGFSVSTAGNGGVTVSIRQTNLSTVTDSEGRFQFGSVPIGDHVFVFEEAGQKADLPIDGVRSSEHIELVVSLSGSKVQVHSINRGGGGSAAADGSISLEKSTNGEDADLPTGPMIPVGEPVTWEYEVTNNGSVDLLDVVVTDDQGVAVSCPQTTLTVGESMTCTAGGTAQAGQYANLGTATGEDAAGTVVSDDDPSHYFGEIASIGLEKSTNGEDADLPPGPTIAVGDPVMWEYEATNDGSFDLENVTVTDDQGVAVSCPKTTLAVGESMTCTADGMAQVGQYANLGTATGEDSSGTMVSDDDPSHYFGEEGYEELSVEIQPNSWNTNWVESSGTVSALIRGSDIDMIDLGSILLFEDDPASAVAPSSEPRLTGNHVRARFPKAAAFEMLIDPEPGQIRTLTVSLIVAGAPVELSDDIKIVGSGK